MVNNTGIVILNNGNIYLSTLCSVAREQHKQGIEAYNFKYYLFRILFYGLVHLGSPCTGSRYFSHHPINQDYNCTPRRRSIYFYILHVNDVQMSSKGNNKIPHTRVNSIGTSLHRRRLK